MIRRVQLLRLRVLVLLMMTVVTLAVGPMLLVLLVSMHHPSWTH
jgi:hypothetical protein